MKINKNHTKPEKAAIYANINLQLAGYKKPARGNSLSASYSTTSDITQPPSCMRSISRIST